MFKYLFRDFKYCRNFKLSYDAIAICKLFDRLHGYFSDIFLILSNQTCRQVFPANSILSYKYSSAEREKILEQILIRKQEHAVPIGAAVEGCFKNYLFLLIFNEILPPFAFPEVGK